MNLDSEFIRLPLQFDATQLASEISRIPEGEWRKHPQGHVGNTALPLVAAQGDPDNDDVRGPMLPTPYLARCPYLTQVLASLKTVIGRTRLMRIEGNGEATMHVDTNYYWMNRVRVHVPVVTFPEVEFICGETSIAMPPGECWIFDTWRMHNVLNHRPIPRIHLVCDTVGTVEFWEMVERGVRPGDPEFRQRSAAPLIPYDPRSSPDLAFESHNFPVVMPPGEQWALAEWIWSQLSDDDLETAEPLREQLDRFLCRWRATWAQYGAERDGHAAYRAALGEFDNHLGAWVERVHLPNTADLAGILRQALVRPGLNPDLASGRLVAGPSTVGAESKTETVRAEVSPHRTDSASPRAAVEVRSVTAPSPAATGPAMASGRPFDRPVFIVSAPRSGSTLLFETLSRSPSAMTIGQESHAVIEGLASLSPARHGWASNRLTAEDADPETVAQLTERFLAGVRAHHQAETLTLPVRLIEKTPKNALRVPFLHAAYPDARFIYLARDAHEAVSSIIEAWRSRRFVTYPEIPGWPGSWSLLLIPGWQHLAGRPVHEIAAAQWKITNEILLDDLSALPKDQWCSVTYSELVGDPQGTMERLCRFADLGWTEDLRHRGLPPARHTLTPPAPDKWRRNAAEIEPVLAGLLPTIERIRKAFTMHETPGSAHRKSVGAAAAPAATAPETSPASSPDLSPLRSEATNTFTQILSQLGASLLVTTYQAGRLVVARVDDGRLNTHFRHFPSPMGLAADASRLALGTRQHVWTFRNLPELGQSLDVRLDACYTPRTRHVTGDIRIHEIGWAGEELWIVNTRFSCLCTLDPRYSFVPRWKPPFITAYTPDDRCHLNGMAIIDGRPKFCTALGATDAAGAWRENKPAGGILLDVDSGETVLRGLSMPHSPRLYRDRLWILNSGRGTLETVDLQAGKTEVVARLPGFTRGLDFIGDYAFIGLSQVRETAVFSGIPITEQNLERQCGVWVVDLRTGQIAAFLRFLDQVQEIFAVQVLPRMRFPDVLDDDDRVAGAFSLPDDALQQVPEHLRGQLRSAL